MSFHWCGRPDPSVGTFRLRQKPRPTKGRIARHLRWYIHLLRPIVEFSVLSPVPLPKNAFGVTGEYRPAPAYGRLDDGMKNVLYPALRYTPYRYSNKPIIRPAWIKSKLEGGGVP